MKKGVKINKKDKTVSIKVTVPKRKRATDPIIQVRTRDVVGMLKEEGVSFKEECIEECTVSNEKDTSIHKGKWVFSLVNEENKAKNTKKTSPDKPKARKTVKTAVEEGSESVVFANKSTFDSKTLDKAATK